MMTLASISPLQVLIRNIFHFNKSLQPRMQVKHNAYNNVSERYMCN